jgi:hypothetical protein
VRARRGTRWLVVPFVLALVLAAGLGVRAVVHGLRLSGGPPPTIEGWMTPGYIVQSFDLEPEAMAAALGLEPGSARGKTLEDIATARDVPLADLIAAVEAVIEARRGAGE